MNAFPARVKIGPTTFTIHTEKYEIFATTAEADFAGGDMAGASFAQSNQIWVDTDGYSDGEVKATLLHEILHCCTHVSGVHWLLPRAKRDELEEAFVSAMTTPMLSVLQDNPELVAWLGEQA